MAGPSADLFSFGVLAHELLLGQLPFATPPILDALAGRAVASLIRRCIDADSAVRPTAAEALAVLEAS